MLRFGQVAFADKIILNKIDLINAEERKDVLSRIRSINSFAPVIEAEYSTVPIDQVRLTYSPASTSRCPYLRWRQVLRE